MAFLDNSGDIILDAVLTDAGRQRLSRGNFKIVKFALGDEEINYSVFNGSHPSGSAFYDLEVMQTPILEAFTNNTSLMKSKLITMTRNNILYMPILKLNTDGDNKSRTAAINTDLKFDEGFILLADTDTEQFDSGDNSKVDYTLRNGILRGQGTNTSLDTTRHIVVDQGIDSTEGGLSFKQPIQNDLVETAFLIKMDHRLMVLHSPSADLKSSVRITNQFVDDDGIATYYVVEGDGSTAVEGAPATRRSRVLNEGTVNRSRNTKNILTPEFNLTKAQAGEVFDGPVGSILRMYPKTTSLIQNSTALFNELGKLGSITYPSGIKIGSDASTTTITSFRYIDTIINVVGVTTGYSIDIPIRIVKSM